MAVLTMKEIAEATQGRIINGDENRVITDVSTNSKTGSYDTLFIPVIGERHDAHDFISDAYANGMRATFTQYDKIMTGTEEMTYLLVDDSVKALQRLGAFYRRKFSIPVVGITGSVGKTTTKEMVSAALSTTKNVLKTEGNKNSQIGLPQMMLRLKEEHEIAIIEMGMSEFHEMERISEVAKPDAAIMTNIGVSHIGQLKTQKNIRKEKATICDHFTKDSLLLVNGDDPLLMEIAEIGNSSLTKEEKKKAFLSLPLYETTADKLSEAKIVSFGTTKECSVYADEITNDGYHLSFVYHYQKENKAEETEQITLSVLGEHNILNALAALTLAYHYGISPKVSKEGLFNYQPIAMRGGITKAGGLTIIDDTYNASPDSMKGAVNVMLDLNKEGRKAVVFADVLELGDNSCSYHREVGTFIATHAAKEKKEKRYLDLVVTIGEMASYIAEGIREIRNDMTVKSFPDKESALSFLNSFLKPCDAVIIKGSRGMHMEVIVNGLKEHFEK